LMLWNLAQGYIDMVSLHEKEEEPNGR